MPNRPDCPVCGEPMQPYDGVAGRWVCCDQEAALFAHLDELLTAHAKLKAELKRNCTTVIPTHTKETSRRIKELLAERRILQDQVKLSGRKIAECQRQISVVAQKKRERRPYDLQLEWFRQFLRACDAMLMPETVKQLREMATRLTKQIEAERRRLQLREAEGFPPVQKEEGA